MLTFFFAFISDCYMVTSIPELADDPRMTTAVCHFALDMVEELRNYNQVHPEHPLDMRIGINLGPVVAGVVGTKRFLYDIWGGEWSSIGGIFELPTLDVCIISRFSRTL